MSSSTAGVRRGSTSVRAGITADGSYPVTGNYAWEKLYAAVLGLAESSGSLRDRLGDAYRSSLMRIMPERDIPWTDIREHFVDLMNELAPDGQIDVALGAWEEADLRRIVRGLVGVYDAIARKLGG